MKRFVLVVAFTSLMVSMPAIQASGGHDQGHGDNHGHSTGMKHDGNRSDKHASDNSHGSAGHHDKGMSGKMGGMFLVKKNIDGYSVSFHVMKAKPGKEMGGSHDFMIKVEKDGKALTNIVMNTKVVYPGGSSESKRVMKMGDWYMAGYDLGKEGKHQLMILFKTADGKKHKGGVYYKN